MPATRRSLRYTDVKGNRQTLTAEQHTYLVAADRGFDFGWGGLRSTLVVRILRERGLISVDDLLYKPWRVQGRTTLGDLVVQAWDSGANDPTWTVVGLVLHDSQVASCDHCTKDGLRKLVVLTDAAGATIRVGVGCAAKLLDLPARTVTAQATAADKAAAKATHDAWVAWRTARLRVWDRAYGWGGPGRRELAETAVARWVAENPEPTRPPGKEHCD